VPRGAPLFWHEHRLLDDAHHPPVEFVMQEVTHVMAPKRSMYPASGPFLWRIFGDYLRAHFDRTAESDLWTLYVRKPGDKAVSGEW